jgi:hypothetical protein
MTLKPKSLKCNDGTNLITFYGFLKEELRSTPEDSITAHRRVA